MLLPRCAKTAPHQSLCTTWSLSRYIHIVNLHVMRKTPGGQSITLEPALVAVVVDVDVNRRNKYWVQGEVVASQSECSELRAVCIINGKEGFRASKRCFAHLLCGLYRGFTGGKISKHRPNFNVSTAKTLPSHALVASVVASSHKKS